MEDTHKENHVDNHDEALTSQEQDALEDQAPIRAVAIFEAIRREGRTELYRPLGALAMSGLVAGMAMGFSVLLQSLLRSHLPDTEWRPLIDSFGYCFGFLLVILGQLQLFTENTIKAVCPVLDHPSLTVFLRLGRLWSIVLVTNVVGAACFGAALWLSKDVQPEIWQTAYELSQKAVSYGFTETLLRGIGAGWLVAALVWMRPTTGSVQPMIIVLITYVIALAGFTHVVAGTTEAAFLVLEGDRTVGEAVFGYIVPAMLGNLLGGSLIFTMLVWVQIRNELRMDADDHLKE
ncbi:formate/nitrite transporter family protein [Chachezhania antarctica]|uniref:formate/nitrite transporter family protein n=1 Tax=Chachezhania antarctica TaxID=2340860 RepID=UPI000EB33351|nr:formate/nitrite transporter family protein [Chachezhania antarctica]